MRRAFCLALTLLLTSATGAPAAGLFDDGNTAYLAGDNARAVSAYEALLAEGVRSPELETNLGAAYLRQSRRGLAALHFERALTLAPADEDARANLADLRRTNVDKLEGGDEQGPAEIFIRFLAPLPGGLAALGLAMFWTAAFALLALWFARPSRLRAAPLGASAVACFALALLCGGVAAGSAAGQAISLRRAVVVAPAAPAREGPNAKAVSPFEVHEGTALSIEEQLGGFSRVKLANGLVGWVDTAAVERVVPQAWREGS